MAPDALGNPRIDADHWDSPKGAFRELEASQRSRRHSSVRFRFWEIQYADRLAPDGLRSHAVRITEPNTANCRSPSSYRPAQHYSGLCVSGTTTAGTGGHATFLKSGRGSMGRAGALMLRSSNLPKIIFPAVVCSTDVTEISMFLPIILRALSTTTMVPSSR